MIACMILLPFVCAVPAYLADRRGDSMRDSCMEIVTILELLCSVWIFLHTPDSLEISGICGMGLRFSADGFRSLYAMIASFMWCVSTQFSREYFRHYRNKGRYAFFTLITLGATVGLFYSDDLYTTFIFFEIMSFASYPWVAHDQNAAALRAAATYLGISVLGGMVSLMGLFLLYAKLGDLSFAAIRAAEGRADLALPAVLTIFGFAAKAGAFPVHVWLPKAHPVAPAPASALLSGVLTKAGMFGILGICMNLFTGNVAFGQYLLAIALTTMLLGAVLALFSTNLKRTLACSSMSQIGYILTGVACAVILGEEGTLAASGAVTHMVNHSLLKLDLFLCAGCVYMNLHKLELNDIRGFGRGKPLLQYCFLMGALGLAGVPLWNGYVSKTMIHEGLVELGSGYRLQEYIFLFAAGLTTAYMLKLYIALFCQKNPTKGVQAKFDALNRRYMTKRSAIALTLSATLLPILGIFPEQTQIAIARVCAPFLNRPALDGIELFCAENLKGGAITLIIGTLVYLFIVRKWMYHKTQGYINRWNPKFDLENAFYRPVLCGFLPRLLCGVCSVLDKLIDGKFMRDFVGGVCVFALRVCDKLVDGKFTRNFIGGICVTVLRVCDEFIDFLALVFRNLFLDSREALRRGRVRNGFTRIVSNCADRVYYLYRRIARRPDDSVVTDMRYGTFATNAISFGLLVCAVALLGAIVYVFLA